MEALVDMRCPICGGNAYRDIVVCRWLCRCAGPVMSYSWPVPAWEIRQDVEIERFRRRRLAEGFGWSWYDPPPLIDRREEFGDR